MAALRYFNPNPKRKRAFDCVVRAICAVTGRDWDSVYTDVVIQGFSDKDMPSVNSVWRAYLRRLGFSMDVIPNTCPDCYTVEDFADDHKTGRYVLGTGDHAVAIVEGEVLDVFDSRQEIPIYYFYKEDKSDGDST